MLGGGMREQLIYDDMGNITNLTRDSGTPITYNYTGSRLQSLSGGLTGSYTYDANGNALTDRTGMTFRYNHLNLPDSVWDATTQVGYLYDALGTRLRKYSSQGGDRDYVGGIEYGNSGIELIHTGEGVAYRDVSTDTYTYRYNLTDHLGDVRATIYRDPLTGLVAVLQADDYYPFGMRQIVSAGDNRYLYNGKELQGELGEQYDYGARFYDPVIGRWNVVDPLAEVFDNVSPYAYGMNNPLRFTDPTGMAAQDTIRLQEVVVNPPRTNANVIAVPIPRALPRVAPIPPPNPIFSIFALVFLPSNYFDDHDAQRRRLEEFRERHTILTNKTVDDLKKESSKETPTGTGTEVYNRQGGFDQANKDFDDIILPGSARPIPDGRVGKTADGKTVNVRNKSSDGRPTLEVCNPNNQRSETKIRYN